MRLTRLTIDKFALINLIIIGIAFYGHREQMFRGRETRVKRVSILRGRLILHLDVWSDHVCNEKDKDRSGEVLRP